jgi:hypothetical protein
MSGTEAAGTDHGSDNGAVDRPVSVDAHPFRDLAPTVVHLSNDDIVRGLKHYRRIAKQDLLRAELSDDPEATILHAEARRDVYASLAEVASTGTPEEVALAALTEYAQLPFLHGASGAEHAKTKGRENALENVFLMIGLEPKVRREARKRRPPLKPNLGGGATE